MLCQVTDRIGVKDMPEPRLKNKVALITGAGRGIGAAIAQAFANEGAKVIVSDLDDDRGESVANAIGENSTYQHLDVREEADWQQAMAMIEDRYGQLDVLVNNAGITGFDSEQPQPHDPEHLDLEEWRRVHATNLDGVFLGCKYAIRLMRQSGTGSIINLGSRSGVVGIPRASAYASSKSGVRNHTKSVALYCAEEGLTIRCNVIQPAAVMTPMWEPLLGTGDDRQQRIAEFCADTPLRRFAEPSEVAALALYLATGESLYCTGAEFNIDGGLLAGSGATPKK